MIKLRRVVGNSMLPTLRPGQIVITVSPRHIQPGDVVVIKHHDLEKIKRISQIDGRQIYILGDNPSESSDSRNFGWIPATTIKAKVLWYL